MANKNWLKQAKVGVGMDLETHKTLKWQGAVSCRDGEYNGTPQKKLMNTTYIYPAAGGRGVVKPFGRGG